MSGRQNVLIVLNCLFNENIPLAAEPSPPPSQYTHTHTLPGLPPWLFVPTQRGKWPAALLFENCPAVKVAVTFSQCFPGLISSVLISPPPPPPPCKPCRLLLPHPLPPPPRQPAGHGCCHVQRNQQTGSPLFNLFHSTASLIPPPPPPLLQTAQANQNQIRTDATSPTSLQTSRFYAFSVRFD